MQEVIVKVVAAVDQLLRGRGFERLATRKRLQDRLYDQWRRQGAWRADEVHLSFRRSHASEIVVNLEVLLAMGDGEWLNIDGIPVSAEGRSSAYSLPSGLLFRVSDEKLVARAVRDLEKALDWLEENHGTPQRSVARLASPESSGPGKETDVYRAVRARLTDLARQAQH